MIKFLYATFGNKEEAVAVANTLLAENLIACVNVLDGSTSIYRWQGEVQQANEAIFFAKTTALQAEKAVSRIKELHSYNVPCILVLPIEAGLPEFMEWVEGEVSPYS